MKKYKAEPLDEHLLEMSEKPEKKVEKLISIHYIYSHGVLFYWDTPIFTQPKTIGQFISVAAALGRDLYWEEDTWINHLYINVKY